MRNFKLLLLTLLLTTTARTLAQEDNAQKILGCWVFKKIEYSVPMETSVDNSPAPNSIMVCFEAGGKYTTTMLDNNASLTGTYAVSVDGKSITQKRDIQEEGTSDENAEISFTNTDSMVFKLEFGSLYFERKK